MDREQKLRFRKHVGYAVRGLIWYSILVSLLSGIIAEILQTVWRDPSAVDGISSILCAAAGILVLYIRNTMSGKKTDLFKKTEQKMTFRTFAKLFALQLMVQFFFVILTNIIEMVLNSMELSMEPLIRLATQDYEQSILMILYTGIIGPVAEEIVYRGFLLRGLEQYGKVFALVLTSVMFGLAHSTPLQLVFTIPAGFLFAYAAIEYSIKWAILLHILNNLFLGVLLGWLLEQMPQAIAAVIDFGFLGIGFITGILVLVKGYRKLKDWFSANAAPKGCYRYAITLPSVLILFLFGILVNATVLIVSISLAGCP